MPSGNGEKFIFDLGTGSFTNEVFKEFNEQFGTNFEFQLKAMAPPKEAPPE